MITITVAEAWIILHKVRQTNADGKPWGEWGEKLWLKMLDIILHDQDMAVDFTTQECWGILSQVLFTDTFGSGASMKMVGIDVNKKIGRILLDSETESIFHTLQKEVSSEDGSQDRSYREAVSGDGANVPA